MNYQSVVVKPNRMAEKQNRTSYARCDFFSKKKLYIGQTNKNEPTYC